VTPAGLGALLAEWERWSVRVKGPALKIYSRDEIEGGIRRREMFNHYQPKVCLRTGDLLGVECLARWQHPEDGLVPPGLFIGVAERTGLIDDLARVTIAAALSEMHDLSLSGLKLKLSLNVSASLLSTMDFAGFVAAEASRASLSPRNVCLEVTESQIIADPRTPLEVLARLRILGFGLSIDDFGTGYSSFAQLSNIPFDELKIDRQFVHRASADPTARAIYDCSLALARSLPIRSVAEGVEDRADWDLVRSTGCDEAQGYLIARPMEASALPAWHKEWKARRRAEFGFAS
jgi:EAL domain-containing protein (putative c-di-GMP-specific phosphodiesterase class I)